MVRDWLPGSPDCGAPAFVLIGTTQRSARPLRFVPKSSGVRYSALFLPKSTAIRIIAGQSTPRGVPLPGGLAPLAPPLLSRRVGDRSQERQPAGRLVNSMIGSRNSIPNSVCSEARRPPAEHTTASPGRGKTGSGERAVRTAKQRSRSLPHRSANNQNRGASTSA